VIRSQTKQYVLRTSVLIAAGIGLTGSSMAQHGEHSGDDPNRLTDVYLPPQVDLIPKRPAPLLELGNGFLKPGELKDPIRLGNGAIWSPQLIVWGNFRSSVSARNGNISDQSEWANRLDLFAEGRLSPTERVVVGLRPLDKNGEFSGVNLEDGEDNDGANLDIQTFFFEGDFGEIFPSLDREDVKALDIGFGFGRQPVNFQDGVLINDVMDAFTVTRNSLRFGGLSNFRATALLAWNDIERGGIEDEDATMIGLLTASDFTDNYVEIDVLATFSDSGDGLYAGVGSTQRFGGMASTFRANASIALDDASPAVDDGVLLTSVLSWVPHHTHDNLYVGSFVGIGDFTSAARAPGVAGPLGNIGILFAATGLGTVGAPINPNGADVVGGALGYQQIFGSGRSQMIYELGVRAATENRDDNTVAVGARYRRAVGQRTVLTFDAFAGNDNVDDGFYGGRVEFLWRF
jgi:hypothetical protein